MTPDTALAPQVVARLALCLRLATLHQLTNAALRPPMLALVDVVRRFTESGERLQVQVIGESVFVNRQAVRLDQATFESAQALGTLFARLGVQEISFLEPIAEEDVRELLSAIQRHAGSAQPQAILGEHFRRLSLVGGDPDSSPGSLPAQSEGHRLVRTYASVVVSLKRTHDGLAAGRDVRLGQLRRALHVLMELTAEHEPLASALTRLPLPGDPAHAHLAATATLVLLMGRRLGLSRAVLTDLCLSAMLHESPRADAARLAETRLPERDRTLLLRRKRPLRTVLQLLSNGTAPTLVHAARVAHECAQPAIGTGGGARLVAVACAYDRLTRATAQRRGLPPEQALAALAQDTSGRFDPRAVALLVEAVGLHPVGTVVQLADGSVGLVVARPDPADPQRVVVRLGSRTGALGPSVDTAQVRGSIHPLAAGIPVLAWLLREGTL